MTAAQTTSEPTPPADGAPARVGDVTLTIADEIEPYTRGLPVTYVEAVRTGRGFGPNVVYLTLGDGYVESCASSIPGHPIEAVRTGPGIGPNTLLATAADDLLAGARTRGRPDAGC